MTWLSCPHLKAARSRMCEPAIFGFVCTLLATTGLPTTHAAEPVEYTVQLDTVIAAGTTRPMTAPKWHAKTGKLLSTGPTVRYKRNAAGAEVKISQNEASSRTAYSVYDPQQRTWTAWDTIVMLYWLPVKRSVVDLAIESRLSLVESMVFMRLDFLRHGQKFEEGLKSAQQQNMTQLRTTTVPFASDPLSRRAAAVRSRYRAAYLPRTTPRIDRKSYSD